MSDNGSSGKKLSSTQLILIVGIVAILAAVLGVGALIVSRLGGEQSSQSVSFTPSAGTPAFGTGTVVMDERNANNLVEELNRQVREGMYDVKMNMDWTFEDGYTTSEDAYVANSEANTHPVYFDIALGDGTVIYTSPMIPVGSAVDSIKLDTPLDKGDYETVCTYHLLKSEEELEEISSVSVAVRITVKA